MTNNTHKNIYSNHPQPIITDIDNCSTVTYVSYNFPNCPTVTIGNIGAYGDITNAISIATADGNYRIESLTNHPQFSDLFAQFPTLNDAFNLQPTHTA